MRAFLETLNDEPSAKRNPERAIRSGLYHVAAINQIADFRFFATVGGQIGLNKDGGGVFDPGGAGHRQNLADGGWVQVSG